jgi:chaperonin GroEL
MANRVLTGDDAREGVLNGLHKQAAAVKSTLGPRGRNVLFVRPFGVAVTRDGVSVAKEIELEDPLEGAGARLLRMVASSADEDAGDGTTTAVVLAEAIVDQGTRLVAGGYDRIKVADGLDQATKWALAALSAQAIPADSESILHAAVVSLHGEEAMGAIVARAIEKVGPKGMITTDDSIDGKDSLEHQTGFQWEQGWVHPGFVNDQSRMACVLEDPLIFLSDRPIIQCNPQRMGHPLNLMNLLERVAGHSRPLLIIADKIDGEALTVLGHNNMKGTLDCCGVEPPGFGPRRKENLRDLAAAVGASEVFSSEVGHDLSKWDVEQLGTCRRAVIFERRCMLIEPGGSQKRVTERADQLRALRGATDDAYEEEQYSIRLGRLTDGAAIIHVAGATQVEVKERKDRLQDAVFSARAAAEEGILPGGGVALMRAAMVIEPLINQIRDEATRAGARILLRALEAPTRQIVLNAAHMPDVVLNEIKENLVRAGDADCSFGFNAATGEYGDLIEAGIVDPLKVTRIALEKAASIGGLILTTEAVVCHIPPSHAGVQPKGQ